MQMGFNSSFKGYDARNHKHKIFQMNSQVISFHQLQIRQIVNHIDYSMHTIYMKSQIFLLTQTHVQVSVTTRHSEGLIDKKKYNNISLSKVIYR